MINYDSWDSCGSNSRSGISFYLFCPDTVGVLSVGVLSQLVTLVI